MINLRYHIISITAVFLALGLGLALGTSFGNRALVSDLEARQDDLDVEVRETRTRNDQLADVLNAGQERDDRFAVQAVASPLLDGMLEDVPVLVITPKGINEAFLQQVRTALDSSGAEFGGTLRLDSRLALDGDNAVQLAELMNLSSTDPGQVQRALVDRLSTILLSAAAPPSSETPPAPTTSTTTTTVPPPPPSGPTTTTTTTTVPPVVPGQEPRLVTVLRQAGFIEFEPPPGGDASDPVLTNRGYRYLFVTGADADLADEELIFPLISRMAASEPDGVPVVVATGVTGDVLERDGSRAEILAPIREDEQVASRVSTVDNLESFEGVIAAILALEELGRGEHGTYGVGEGADPLPA